MLHPDIQDQINNIVKLTKRIRPVVLINTLTYNHEPYIRDALEGFVRQQTDFPFVAIVHDDASTDRTADIVREYAKKYPNIILPIFEKENQYSKHDGSLSHIIRTVRDGIGAKYVAMCEGDDYWTDPLKLQKQVDFLESHPDYSLVCTQCDKYIQKSELLLGRTDWGIFGEITFNELIQSCQIGTLTVVIRSSVLHNYREFIKDAPAWSFGDYPIWLYAATVGRIMRLRDCTAVYRVLEKSASHFIDNASRLRWAHSSFSVFDYFDVRFKIPKYVRKRALFNLCHSYGSLAISMNDTELTRRIRNYYKKNSYYIALFSFRLMENNPGLSPIYNIIESHLSIKSPLTFIQTIIKKYIGVRT